MGCQLDTQRPAAVSRLSRLHDALDVAPIQLWGYSPVSLRDSEEEFLIRANRALL